jgi:LmbE family N-acetylglucosaminyl deacetylase
VGRTAVLTDRIVRKHPEEIGAPVNVLAIGAHPDDIELYCGGTMARYAEAGHGVFFAVVCDGCSGAPEFGPEEAGRIRAEESRNAASVIGAEVIHLGYPDHCIPTDEGVLLRLADVIRQAEPSVLFSHDPADCFIDHVRVSRLVEEAVFLASARNVETHFPVTPQHPTLFYMDTVVGLSFQPSEYVDVSGVMETKRRMLECHKSQTSRAFSDPNDPTIMEMMEVSARYRGMQCGVRYAEAFRLQQKWDRTTPWRVLP